jgi:hypothetical protein
MCTSVAGTGDPVKAGKQSLDFTGLAVRAADSVFGRCSKHKLFKFRVAFQTFKFVYRHINLIPVLANALW